MILRGLNKGQKKEIYFCNKAKLFSSFLFILMHALDQNSQNSRSLKEAFDFLEVNVIADQQCSALQAST